jgi:hypothetical protein
MNVMHETSLFGVLNILKDGIILKSSKIQEFGFPTCQGKSSRRLSNDPMISLTDSDFYCKYDQVDGVYCRLFREELSFNHRYGQCVLVFNEEILNHNKFIINTEENFGFCIALDGVVAEAQFSGEKGMTISTKEHLDMLKGYKFNHYSSEVLFLENLTLDYLKCVQTKVIDESLMEICNLKNIKLTYF